MRAYCGQAKAAAKENEGFQPACIAAGAASRRIFINSELHNARRLPACLPLGFLSRSSRSALRPLIWLYYMCACVRACVCVCVNKGRGRRRARYISRSLATSHSSSNPPEIRERRRKLECACGCNRYRGAHAVAANV